MRKAVNLIKFGKWEAVLVSKIIKFSEKLPVVFVISLQIDMLSWKPILYSPSKCLSAVQISDCFEELSSLAIRSMSKPIISIR